MTSTYNYNLTTDFGGAVRPTKLEQEIKAEAGIDSNKFDYVTVNGSSVDIVFSAALTANEESILTNTVVPAHDGFAASALIEYTTDGADNTIMFINSSQTQTRTLQLPDATDTLVARNTADTLTQKSIDCATNTLSNIGNAEIKSAANVDVAKLADGSVSNAEFQRLSGVSSNLQAQLDAKSAVGHTHVAANITDFATAADARISAQKAQANGLATLDAGGKVPASQLDLDSVDYQGTWNATTNTPTLMSETGTKGHYYVVSVAGSTSIDGIDDWQVSDWIIFNGWVWEKADHSQQVSSVAGKQGAVTLVAADVTDFHTAVAANSDVAASVTHAADASKHRIINDAGTSATELWSASKIDSELADKSNTGHTHVAANVTDFQTAVSANSDVQAGVTHAANAAKHRIINDAAASATELWSASKIYSELNSKSNAGHTHTASNITDFDTKVAIHTDVAANTSHRANTNNPHSVTKAQLGLADLTNIKSNFVATSAPTTTDDSNSGYSVGSQWVNTSTDRAYICLDPAVSAAHWHEISIDNHSDLANVGTYTHAQIDTHLDDDSLHRTIDDASTSATKLWSASQISTQLATKVATASNVGMGTPIFKQKTGDNLEFKKITGSSTLAVASTSVVHCYDFENDVTDTMGDQHGTIVGGVTYVTGKVGSKAAQFDGVSGTMVTLGNLEVPNQSAFSISLWFNVDLFTDARLVSKAYGTSTTQHIFALIVPSASGVGFRLSAGGLGTGTQIDGSTSLSTGTWYHMVAWYDGTNYKIYLNGAEDASGSKSGLVPLDPSINTSIGNQPPGGGGDRAFHGKIDQVAFWDSALTQGEITALYNSGVGEEITTFSSDQVSFAVNQSALNHDLLSNVGNNTHAQIDAHINDQTIHFTIEDSEVSLDQAWSSSKINSELDLKSTLAANETMSGQKTLSAHAAIGADASISTASVLAINEKITAAATLQGVDIRATADALTSGLYWVRGMAGYAIVQNANYAAGSNVTGLVYGVYAMGIGGHASNLDVCGISTGIYQLVGATLNVNNMTGGEFFAGRDLLGSTGVTNATNVYVVRLLNGDDGLSATNHYGLYVEEMNRGTNSYTIYTEGGTHRLGGPLDVVGNIAVSGSVDGRDIANDGATLDSHVANVANPHAVSKSQVGLGNVPNLKVKLDGTAAPGVTADAAAGYGVGSAWIDTTADRAYVCVDATTNAAVWRQIGIIDHGDLQNIGSNTHAQIDAHIADSSKHRVINDSGTSTIELWSASKISAQLATKSSAEHAHVAAHISDFGSAADARIALQKGANNGLATLDGSGKVPASQLDVSGVEYQGTWNASTNTPTITGATGTKGHYYVVSVSGTTSIDGETDWVVGDWIIYNGVAWEKADHTSAVTSVAGKQGAVTLQAGDITDFDAGVNENANVTANTAHRSNTSNPHSVTKAQIGLGNVANLKNTLNATEPPSSSDHDAAAGYSVGSMYIDISANKAYVCVDNTNDAAQWCQINVYAHSQLSGAGNNSHADIDNHIADVTKHRIINDAGTSATELWSASNISTQLATKSATGHTHIKANITDFAEADYVHTTGAETVAGIKKFTNQVVANDQGFSSIYPLSVQGGTAYTYLEILNSGGADKGVFFGAENNNFTLYNWQGGHILFYVDTLPSSGALKFAMENNGVFRIYDLSTGVVKADAYGRLSSGTITDSDVSNFHTAVETNNSVAANTAHAASTSNPHSVTKAQVGLSNVQNIKVKLDATLAPSASDDSAAGYSVGSLWFDVTANRVYACVDAIATDAFWRQIGIDDHADLSGVGSNTHAQIDTHIADASKHRIINDAGTSATELWSSSKINTALNTKAASSHTHMTSDITDFTTAVGSHTDVAASVSHAADATKHRIINDSGTSATELWSASKINTQLAGKVAGPSSATDNRLARFNGSTGKLIQNSTVTLDDNGSLSNLYNVLSKCIDIETNYVGSTNHISFRMADDYVSTGDPFSHGVDTSVAQRCYATSQDGTYRQATLVVADVASAAGTVFGVTTSSDSGDTWNQRLIVQQDGKIGINKASPAQALDVVGNIAVTGTVDGRDIASDAAHFTDTGNPHSVTKAQVGLGNVPNLKQNLAATVAPTATDDASSGYAVGSHWINTSADKAYICLDATQSGAVWTETTQTTGGGGDVTGPSSSTDNYVARFDGTTGKVLQGATAGRVSYDDSGALTVEGTIAGYALDIHNMKVDGGGGGLRIMGGELQNDIVLHIADADDTFQIMEIHADDGEVTLGKTFAQTASANGVVYGVDNQHTNALSCDYNTQVGTYRIGGTDVVDVAQTLTNKTLTATSNNVTAKGLHSATTTVSVSGATAPTANQVLTAVNSTTATWQTPTDWTADQGATNIHPSNINFTRSIGTTASEVYLVNDEATPAASKYYGTNSGGTRGYHAMPVFGTQYHYAASDSESTTTSTTLQLKTTLTTSQLPAGTYRLGFTCEISNGSNGVLTEVAVTLDGTIVQNPTMEADNDFLQWAGFVHQSLSGVVTATIKHRVQTTGTSKIRRARLELWRVS